MQNEADEHQRKADEIAEQMNDGISPYAWYVKKNFDEYIDSIHYKADYLVYLDRIQQAMKLAFHVKFITIYSGWNNIRPLYIVEGEICFC